MRLVLQYRIAELLYLKELGKTMVNPKKSSCENVICYFCKGTKLITMCETVRVEEGGRAYKCKDCKRFDEKFKEVKNVDGNI